jgi:hypothetical protein
MNHICIRELPDESFTLGKLYKEISFPDVLIDVKSEICFRNDNHELSFFLFQNDDGRSGIFLRYSDYFEDEVKHTRNHKIEKILKIH